MAKLPIRMSLPVPAEQDTRLILDDTMTNVIFVKAAHLVPIQNVLVESGC